MLTVQYIDSTVQLYAAASLLLNDVPHATLNLTSMCGCNEQVLTFSAIEFFYHLYTYACIYVDIITFTIIISPNMTIKAFVEVQIGFSRCMF